MAIWLVFPAQGRAESGTESSAVAQEPTPQASVTPVLPIRVHSYPITAARQSTSKKVFLFDDPKAQKPLPGRVILIVEPKGEEKVRVAGVRVLRTYPDTQQFAAKVIKHYSDYPEVPVGAGLIALEKMGDYEAPAATNQDERDLKELEAAANQTPITPDAEAPSATEEAAPLPLPSPTPTPEVLPFDPELDAGVTPPAAGATDSDYESEDPFLADDRDPFSDEPDGGFAIEEILPLEHYRHSLSIQSALVTALSSSRKTQYYRMFAAGVRYGLTLGKMIFFKDPKTQDTLTLEGSLFAYRPLNYAQSGDAYTVVALGGTGRYTINFNNRIGVFGYMGLLANQVVSINNGTESAKAALSSAFPSVGLGVLYNIGPNWDFRLELGSDMLAGGLMLRF